MKKSYKENTKLMHLGVNPDDYFGLVNPPIGRASTILYPSLEAYEDPNHKYRYGRLGTPLSDAFEGALAEMEGGHGAVSTCSGLSAITLAVTAFLKAGDHILVTDSLYPPSRSFFDRVAGRFGVGVEYYDPMIGSGIAALVKEDTAVIYMESPGTGTYEVQDVPAIVKAAKEKDILTVLDNSWASGYLFKPLEHGVNISVLSATKYISGHSDVNLGVVIAGKEEHYKQLRQTANDLGGCAGAEDLYMGLRGLRTLPVRMKQNAENAQAVIDWIKDRPEVQKIYYPVLEGHPGHEIWKRDFSGANGVFSILLQKAPRTAVKAFVEGLELFPIGSSWGGYESLLQPQYLKTCRTAVPWEEDGFLIRLQIGLEDPEDLIADLEAGFKKFAAAL